MSGPRATEAPLQGACISASSGAIDQSVCPATLKYRVGVCFSTPPLIAILLLLAGCATTAPTPIAIGTAPPLPAVQVPVFRPCIDPAQLEPDPPSSAPPSTAGVAELAAGVAADALRYRELARRRGDLLKACATKGETK